MSSTPDSLLKAAQHVASIARVPWKDVFPVYRALQREGFLPKSAGRRVYPATPRAIALLIIALATSNGETLDPTWFAAAGEGDAGTLMGHIERALTRHEDPALLTRITFTPEEEEALVEYHGGQDYYFYTERHPSHPSHEDAVEASSVLITAPMFQHQTVVSGALLYRLGVDVTWGTAPEEAAE